MLPTTLNVLKIQMVMLYHVLMEDVLLHLINADHYTNVQIIKLDVVTDPVEQSNYNAQ
jgi:hypothetical protein